MTRKTRKTGKTKSPDDGYLPVSPMRLVCPLCHAKPGGACETSAGGYLEIVHVARIKIAANMDAARKRAAKKR